MSTHLVTGISELVTNDPGVGDQSLLGIIKDAAIVVEDGIIAWVGERSKAPDADTRNDLGGTAVVPGFVDSHTHAVFGGDRAEEFAARMTGSAYEGSGIWSTVEATREATDEELTARLGQVLTEMRAQGTTACEIKSGYGLDVETERRMLQVAATVTDEVTFMGAHMVPRNTDRRTYIDLVCGDMLEACAPHAKWIDVFCEPASDHGFDGDEAREILAHGSRAGLELRVNASHLAAGPGVKLAVEMNAASVDHCTHLTYGDVDALVGGAPTAERDGTIATLLPGVEFSTRSQYPNARAMWDAGVVIALASGINPGSCYSSSMPFVIALAVREMRMTPAEALWSATAGGALALRRPDLGRILTGARAGITVLDAPSYVHLAYRPGVPIAWALDL